MKNPKVTTAFDNLQKKKILESVASTLRTTTKTMCKSILEDLNALYTI